MRKPLPSKKVVKRFLFFPKIINKEWRWLEFAKIERELVYVSNKWIWIDINWV